MTTTHDTPEEPEATPNERIKEAAELLHGEVADRLRLIAELVNGGRGPHDEPFDRDIDDLTGQTMNLVFELADYLRGNETRIGDNSDDWKHNESGLIRKLKRLLDSGDDMLGGVAWVTRLLLEEREQSEEDELEPETPDQQAPAERPLTAEESAAYWQERAIKAEEAAEPESVTLHQRNGAAARVVEEEAEATDEPEEVEEASGKRLLKVDDDSYTYELHILPVPYLRTRKDLIDALSDVLPWLDAAVSLAVARGHRLDSSILSEVEQVIKAIERGLRTNAATRFKTCRLEQAATAEDLTEAALVLNREEACHEAIPLLLETAQQATREARVRAEQLEDA